MKKIYLITLLFLFWGQLKAQTLPVGILGNVEDAWRRQQLLGKDSIPNSFMIRPLNIYNQQKILFNEDNNGGEVGLHNFSKQLYTNASGKIAFSILPIVWQQQYNTHHPYGMNDGSMIPARGYQTQFSAGVYLKAGPLSIQLRPEFVFAENKNFRELYEADNGATFINNYKRFYNNIDLPERFGDRNYKKANWGQSSVRLTFDPVSIGLSNENLWWGPGTKSSLLMSNNAPGFKHLTLNTSRPVKSYIGSFEAQIVGGRLDNSGIANPLLKAKPDDWRYFSGIVMTYQPKWIPNLFMGFDRSFIVAHNNIGKGFGAYFPIFSPVEKSAYGDPDLGNGINDDDKKLRDQYISVFARWIMPESHSEIYVEFGRNDHAYDLRDLLVEPEHSRAYVVGFRKLIPLKKANDEYIQVGIEFTQMEGSKTGKIREQPIWYAYGASLASGYTQKGQVLGAGIGPGSNLQSLDIAWVKGLKKIGLQFERLVHNNDFFYTSSVVGIRNNWVDLSFAGKFDFNYKKLIFSSQLTYIRALNYYYELKPGQTFWSWDKQDANNLQLKVGVMYAF